MTSLATFMQVLRMNIIALYCPKRRESKVVVIHTPLVGLMEESRKIGVKSARTDPRMEVEQQKASLQADAREGLQAAIKKEAPDVALKLVAQKLEAEAKSKTVCQQDILDGVKQRVQSLIDNAKTFAGECPEPWNQPSSLLRGALAVMESTETQMLHDNRTVMKWGKYAGQSVEKVLQDTKYCQWVLTNQHKISHPDGLRLVQRLEKEYVMINSRLRRVDQLEPVLQKSELHTPEHLQGMNIQQLVQQEVAKALGKGP